MNKNLLIGIGIVVLLIVIGLTVSKDDMSTEQAMMDDSKEALALQDDEKMEKDEIASEETMMDDEVEKMDSEEDMMSAGSYEPYAPEKLAMAEKGDVVLFFKASWCPSCRALDTDIKKSLEDIPAGVTILEVNYDSEIELKKKYGVTTQHTLVQVSADGSEIQQWAGSTNLEQVLAKL